MKFLLLFICLTVTPVIYGQKKKSLPPPTVLDKVVRNNSVKYTLLKRLSFYPFSFSSQIKIVSFGLQLDSIQRKHEENYKLPMLHDTICLSKLDEIKALTLRQVDTLTDILFNECSRWNISIGNEAGCYYPRNAILFLDTTGKAFEYIEICFECSRMVRSNPLSTMPDRCENMYQRLETFFKSLNIRTSSEELKKNIK